MHGNRGMPGILEHGGLLMAKEEQQDCAKYQGTYQCQFANQCPHDASEREKPMTKRSLYSVVHQFENEIPADRRA